MAQRAYVSALGTLLFPLLALAQLPNLSVTITADATPVATGTPIGFTITVGNSSAAGTATAVNVLLTDPLPVGPGLNWSISPAYGGPGMCSITGSAPQILNCPVGNLAPGATAIVHVQSPTTAPPGSSAGSYGNAPFATADNELTPHGAVATIVVLPPPPPNLNITKTADATPVATGTPIGFTITVGNSSAAGTGIAVNVQLTDGLPGGPGLNWSISPAYIGPGTCMLSGTPPSQTLNCSFGNLARGATAMVHVQSPTTAPPGSSAGSYGNAALATADNETTGVFAVANIVVNPPPPPNLSITKTADATPVATGTPIGFTITVGNSSAAGTGIAVNVQLTDGLPGGPGLNWSISPAYIGPGTCMLSGTPPSQTLNCSFGNLARGATAMVHVQSPTTAPPGSSAGSYGNAALATADNETTGVFAVANIVVNPPPPPNLSITKTADATPVATGTPIGFTITVGNSSAAGTGIAVNVQLTDGLPGGPGLNWSISPAYIGPGTCTLSGTPPSQTLNCSFGNLARGATAMVHVQSPTTAPPGSSAGSYGNAALATADNETTGVFAVANIVVNPPPPTVTKTFGAATIPLSGHTSLSFTLANPNAFAATGILFSDPLPAGMVVSTPNGLSSTCTGSTITATAGTSVINFSGGTLAANGSCMFSVNVTGIALGVQNNTTGPISSNESGPTTTTSNTASLTVAAPPTITKAFGAATVPPGGSTTLSFTITDPNAGVPLSGVGFTDNLPAGVVVASPNGLTGSCGGGSITATAGSSTVSLTGATIAGGASCTFSLDVVGTTEGVKTNTTSAVTSVEGGNGNAATASFRVASPPTITKAFADSEIQLFGPSNSTVLSFTLTNPNTVTTLTGLAFTDTLPSGLIVSTPNGLTGSCGGGTITATAGSNSISLSGATLAPGASCTFSVNVTGTEIGVQINTTSTVTSNEAVPGAPATATTSVDDSFFLWFFLESGAGGQHP